MEYNVEATTEDGVSSNHTGGGLITLTTKHQTTDIPTIGIAQLFLYKIRPLVMCIVACIGLSRFRLCLLATCTNKVNVLLFTGFTIVYGARQPTLILL